MCRDDDSSSAASGKDDDTCRACCWMGGATPTRTDGDPPEEDGIEFNMRMFDMSSYFFILKKGVIRRAILLLCDI